MSQAPKVSVVMITYNHERFIEEAVRSALHQVVPFEYEILVSDDASRDQTPSILRRLDAEFPGRLKLTLRPQNVGMLPNFTQTVQACQGKYIAILEGDDYWTSPDKLRKQVEFLDAHPDYSMCHHNALRAVEGAAEPFALCHTKPYPAKQTLKDFMRGNPVVTCTAMLRRGLIPTIPDWYYQLKMGDWSLHILNAQQGPVGYIDEVMAAYRIHSASNWSSRNRYDDLTAIIAAMDVIQPNLDTQHGALMRDAIDGYREELVHLLLAQGKAVEAQGVESKLSRHHGLARLQNFHRALQLEREGHRWQSSLHLLKALATGWGRTPVRAPDIALALFRTNFPRLYSWLRGKWRGQSIAASPEDSDRRDSAS